jgi:hypothetical protein
MTNEEQMMNTAKAAEYLEITPNYLAGMRHYGTGPTFCQSKSGRVAYRREDLDAWDQARQARRTSQRHKCH